MINFSTTSVISISSNGWQPRNGVISRSLMEVASRFFSDAKFRQRLINDPIDTLEASEILVSDSELELLKFYVEQLKNIDPSTFALGLNLAQMTW